MQTLKTAWRSLGAAPAHVVGMTSSLTVGLTLSLLAWVVATGLIYGDLPGLHERHRIARLHLQHNNADTSETVSGRQVGSASWSRQDLEILTSASPAALLTSGAEAVTRDVVRIGQSTLSLSIAHAAGDYFETLGTTAAQGRLLTPVDARSDAAVLGDGLWRAIGEPSDVLGRTVTIGSRTYTVVGVAPRNFGGLRVRDIGDGMLAGPQVWVPLDADLPLQAFGRLAQGAFAGELTTRLAGVASTLEHAGAQPRAGLQIVGQTFGLDPSERPAVAIAAVAMFMLLPLGILGLAVMNVVNLQLARMADSERTVRIRLALGGSPTQATRWLAVEVLLLTIASAALALLIVRAVLPAAQSVAPFVAPVGFATVAAAVALAAGVVLLGGWLPAWTAARRAAATGPRITIPATTRFRRVLVVAQSAAALTLVFVASVSVRSIQIAARDFGDVDRIAIVQVEQPRLDLVEVLTRDPSVVAAGFGSFMPRAGRVRYWPTGTGDGSGVFADGGEVSPSWFEAIGATLLAGQLPEAGSNAVVVSEGLAARQATTAQEALGQTIRLGSSNGEDERGDLVTIAAVVQLPYRSSASQPIAAIFSVTRGPWTPASSLVVRGRTGAPSTTDIRRALEGNVADVMAVQVTPLRSVLDGGLVDVRLLANTFSTLGGAALMLATSGLLALLLVGVRTRRREFAVRAALGASGRSLSGVVVRDVVRLLTWGVVIGSVAGVAAASALRSQVANTSAVDPWAMVVTAIVMLVTATAAAALPAWYASRVPPAEALKQ
jgi:putative ABC transport system permease protein